MGTPYSNDLRLRVPPAVPVPQVAALLRVSVSYIYKALGRADARPASSRAMSRRC